MTMLLAPVNHRWQLGDLCNEKGLTNLAVEIGTHRGVFAEAFRRVWQGKLLYCVDPWDIPRGYEEQAKLLANSDGDRNKDMAAAIDLLERWINEDEVRMVTSTSSTFAMTYREWKFDFVYLDADHRREMVEHDILLYWNMLGRGGILAGHDFICPGEKDGSADGWGVHIQPAVLNFAEEEGLDVRLIPEFGRNTAGDPWSWYIEKPKETT